MARYFFLMLVLVPVKIFSQAYIEFTVDPNPIYILSNETSLGYSFSTNTSAAATYENYYDFHSVGISGYQYLNARSYRCLLFSFGGKLAYDWDALSYSIGIKQDWYPDGWNKWNLVWYLRWNSNRLGTYAEMRFGLKRSFL